ncbi:MAG: tetratricopeptide repeat protein, partial [Campylobacterota bacterium]|nr:tetratricopeptide repeat protein [Campylobacterota bacterium]
QRFVVRQEVFDEVFEALQGADYSVPNQHHILVGQRGQGKTTILRKINIEITKDKKLSKFLIPVQFTEEQYSMRGLCSLWERVVEHLEDHYAALFEDALEQIEMYEDDDNYEMKCFSYLEKLLKKQKKKLVLLIDNINILLESLNEQEQHHLREILLTSSSFIIVGGSTKMFEQQYEYSKPFYEFFNIIALEGLTFEESVALLKILGDKEQTQKIAYIIEHNPARIETLRRVTGGVPRTMVMLFDIFIEDNGDTFNDLMKVLDDVTPLYQERMNHIPKVLQNITHAIAINWDGMLTKEIAKKTKLESKVVSAQLKQLEKYQIIDSVSLGKNKIYSIKERFFNIWYLMRFGKKKDRNRVEWLIQFLLAWYSRDELEKKAKFFMDRCKTSEYNPQYVLQYTEALSYTGINDTLESELKQSTKSYFDEIGSSLTNDLSPSNHELYQKTIDAYNNNDKEKAIKILEKSGKENGTILYNLGVLYDEKKEYDKAEKYYLKSIESGNTNALYNLGILYKEKKEYDKAEKYYLKAIESGEAKALNNLGNLYKEKKEYDKAEKYYLKAIESGNTNALYNLGILYKEKKEYDKAEKYYLKAI